MFFIYYIYTILCPVTDQDSLTKELTSPVLVMIMWRFKSVIKQVNLLFTTLISNLLTAS